MSTAAEQNIALVEQWADAFNHDLRRMVYDIYSPDAVLGGFAGGLVLGHEKFLEAEQGVLAASPSRVLRIDKLHASGDNVVVVEAVLLEPDEGPEYVLPFCVVLTIVDGKIISDCTYADMTRWPGLRG